MTKTTKQLEVITSSGVAIPLIHSVIFNFEDVQVDQVVSGICKDKEKFKFRVVTKTKRFLICENLKTNTEHAFSSDGAELAVFSSYKLTSPCLDKFSYPVYLMINPQNKILAASNHYIRTGSDQVTDVKIINRTHPKNHDLIIEVSKANNLDESFVKGYVLQ